MNFDLKDKVDSEPSRATPTTYLKWMGKDLMQLWEVETAHKHSTSIDGGTTWDYQYTSYTTVEEWRKVC